jgi:hypothetical protein
MARHEINSVVIQTSHDFPPIPDRSHDWSAVLDNYDGAPDAGYQPVGHGATEQEAIDNLLEILAEDANDDHDIPDNEADAETLASAGWGTDEDYGFFGGDDY